ncbi:ornithine cyclodeaminase family protein [Pelomonas sp. KK5]|uniref:ornithine cyclodeaminase family protein n=1 Tax=Pelomonas sp. KK5 TaxID=1855730 RepID=UPI00097BB898|nr:ornithine cyclodeaminase family protein [Pelomonas sp. KK5]
MKQIDAAAARRALAFKPLISALETMLVTGCEVPPRQVHTVGKDLTVLIMPAWQPGRFLGVKTVNIAPHNAARGMPGLFATYTLYDAQTGVPLAAIDGNEITARRTAAASALAASKLARPDARRLLVVGAGRVSSLLPHAYRAMFPGLQQVMVWARRPDSAIALAERLMDEGLDAFAVPNLAAAVAEADIVSTATLATEPVIHGAWLAPGSHLDLIGSFAPTMREADEACFTGGASLWVDTEEALAKSGDLLAPLQSGVITAADVRGTLADLCRDGPGRADAQQRTVFKSVGTALADLAAAILVYESN